MDTDLKPGASDLAFSSKVPVTGMGRLYSVGSPSRHGCCVNPNGKMPTLAYSIFELRWSMDIGYEPRAENGAFNMLTKHLLVLLAVILRLEIPHLGSGWNDSIAKPIVFTSTALAPVYFVRAIASARSARPVAASV